MTDKPIIFSAPMVQALLAGRKSQTRRVLRTNQDGRVPCYIDGQRAGEARPNMCQPPFSLTRYAPGDRLYVRETWSARMTHGWTIADARSGYYQTELLYRADGHESIDGWWSSIHMPREFSRLTLTVTEVRVQRLQEISEADARAEGVTQHRYGTPRNPSWTDHKTSFEWLWNNLHGPDAWDANPWVAAISFTVQHGNIDAVGK